MSISNAPSSTLPLGLPGYNPYSNLEYAPSAPPISPQADSRSRNVNKPGYKTEKKRTHASSSDPFVKPEPRAPRNDETLKFKIKQLAEHQLVKKLAENSLVVVDKNGLLAVPNSSFLNPVTSGLVQLDASQPLYSSLYTSAQLLAAANSTFPADKGDSKSVAPEADGDIVMTDVQGPIMLDSFIYPHNLTSFFGLEKSVIGSLLQASRPGTIAILPVTTYGSKQSYLEAHIKTPGAICVVSFQSKDNAINAISGTIVKNAPSFDVFIKGVGKELRLGNIKFKPLTWKVFDLRNQEHPKFDLPLNQSALVMMNRQQSEPKIYLYSKFEEKDGFHSQTLSPLEQLEGRAMEDVLPNVQPLTEVENLSAMTLPAVAKSLW